jgi:hypothetical protein
MTGRPTWVIGVGGQFHQPFLLELALKPFREGFAEPQGVDQRLI